MLIKTLDHKVAMRLYYVDSKFIVPTDLGKVCNILEGGKEAFKKRYTKMTIGDDHV